MQLEKQLGMPHARASSKMEQFANSLGLTHGESPSADTVQTQCRHSADTVTQTQWLHGAESAVLSIILIQ